MSCTLTRMKCFQWHPKNVNGTFEVAMREDCSGEYTKNDSKEQKFVALLHSRLFGVHEVKVGHKRQDDEGEKSE